MNMHANNVVSVTPAAPGWHVHRVQDGRGEVLPLAAWIAYADPVTSELHVVPAWPEPGQGGRLATPLDCPAAQVTAARHRVDVDF